jgi:hypothetical protein
LLSAGWLPAGAQQAHWQGPLPKLITLAHYQGSGENGKRYQHHHRRAQSTTVLTSIYPYNPKHSISAPTALIRLQQRCNLDSSLGDAYTFFPPNLQFGEAGGDAPV